MTRAVDALVAAARTEAGSRGTSDAREAADRAVSTARPSPSDATSRWSWTRRRPARGSGWMRT